MSTLAAPAAPVQQPAWPDPGHVATVRDALADRPPLVGWAECADLLAALADAHRGERLVLQAGDCAERFADATDAALDARIAHLYALADALRADTGRPCVTVGRLAGQYAKPRSSPTQTLGDGTVLPAYRGDLVNGCAPTAEARRPDPRRMLTGYDSSALALARVRASRAGRPAAEALYASHEALLVDYEQPLVRAHATGRYASSGHLVWIGDRSRDCDGWHVRWAAALDNPVAVKIGPTTTPHDAVRLSRLLNPHGVPRKLAFVTRLGARHVHRLLPDLVTEVTRRGAPVLWLCDPMHGNTVVLRGGAKTRPLQAIHDEVAGFVRALRYRRQPPAGLHLEVAPDDVTECVATPEDTPAVPDRVALPRYTSACDPRLSPAQARALLAHFARLL
ncbi:3-deoxy-7-phosphoheptulonate synthase [Micromonospora okii]|uniref:3-deoxy-7-phosphoheptulonate synthase n=1 Tax=Micromonospora okii TaxID=1182970 RepID=UPI001E494463|nr:3-deoxy-7-phosphoheptulonate synthase [Micromonospora okii]